MITNWFGRSGWVKTREHWRNLFLVLIVIGNDVIGLSRLVPAEVLKQKTANTSTRARALGCGTHGGFCSKPRACQNVFHIVIATFTIGFIRRGRA